MNKYNQLFENLKLELDSKQVPGPILDEIMFRRLEEFSKLFKHNHRVLMVGALLADIRLQEAKEEGEITNHVDYALAYAEQIYWRFEVPEKNQKVINEIISTHHGGEQTHIESKIFKNADNFKFLETRGCFHFFGSLYQDNTPQNLEAAVIATQAKLKEKLELTDLSPEVEKEANKLYKKNNSILEAILN